MRRRLVLPLIAALAVSAPLCSRAPLGAQVSAYVPGGTATLTEIDTGFSRLDLQLQYLFGKSFKVPLQFDPEPWAHNSDFSVYGVLHNGATVVGSYRGSSGPVGLGVFFVFVDQSTLIGDVRPDGFTYPLISNSCDPVTPSGYLDDGMPYYGSVGVESPWYISTCAPGSYVDISMVIPHASSFIGLDPVIATPEPSTFALLATGIVGLAAFTRRKRVQHLGKLPV